MQPGEYKTMIKLSKKFRLTSNCFKGGRRSPGAVSAMYVLEVSNELKMPENSLRRNKKSDAS